MKKILSLALAALMLLSLGAGAFAEERETIPGTEFPTPDAINSVKTVEVSRLEEQFMLEILGVDILMEFTYADDSAASQALNEYRARMEFLFPSLTDGMGNVLEMPDGASASCFSLAVVTNKEPLSFVGLEGLGWFDISPCGEALTVVQSSELEKRMGVSTKDGLAGIQCLPYEFGDLDPDFSYVCEFLLKSFTHDAVGKPIPEDENAYRNIEAEELELDGAPAYKVSFETDDLWERCEAVCGVSYVTEGPEGGYVRINLRAPKDGHLDENGAPYRPGVEELCRVVEESYTRTAP